MPSPDLQNTKSDECPLLIRRTQIQRASLLPRLMRRRGSSFFPDSLDTMACFTFLGRRGKTPFLFHGEQSSRRRQAATARAAARPRMTRVRRHADVMCAHTVYVRPRYPVRRCPIAMESVAKMAFVFDQWRAKGRQHHRDRTRGISGVAAAQATAAAMHAYKHRPYGVTRA
jgi:hypothetical protein